MKQFLLGAAFLIFLLMSKTTTGEAATKFREKQAECRENICASGKLPFDDGLNRSPSITLRKQFPMCDIYLDVTWIDEQKRIGYAHYVAKMLGDKGEPSAEKKTAWALVSLADENPSYTLDIYLYKRQKRMKELFELVRKGRPGEVAAHFSIRHQAQHEPVVFYDAYAPIFSNHEKTVCIAYPDGLKAWIIEAPNVRSKYSRTQMDALHERLKFPHNPRANKTLEELWVVDLNFDGLDDFVWSDIFSSWGAIAYSSATDLHQVKHATINENHVITSQQGNRTCDFKWSERHPLTTDGKNYFLGRCNLTQLTNTFKE